MKTVSISKDKLLKKVKENRDLHAKQFKEALDGWHESVIEELEVAVVNARRGIKYKTHFNLPEPFDHTQEYNSLISQIEWNEEAKINISLDDFNKFIMDEWI